MILSWGSEKRRQHARTPGKHKPNAMQSNSLTAGLVGELYGRSCEEGRGSVRVSADAGCAREQTKRQADALLQFGWFDKWGDASLVPRARCRRIQSSERSEIRTAGLRQGNGKGGIASVAKPLVCAQAIASKQRVENKPRWGIL